jgi:hypothetical protein
MHSSLFGVHPLHFAALQVETFLFFSATILCWFHQLTRHYHITSHLLLLYSGAVAMAARSTAVPAKVVGAKKPASSSSSSPKVSAKSVAKASTSRPSSAKSVPSETASTTTTAVAYEEKMKHDGIATLAESKAIRDYDRRLRTLANDAAAGSIALSSLYHLIHSLTHSLIIDPWMRSS